ncbi:Cation efflux system protein CusB precursor [Poriferisphaera corsica]|uniref:Cation efflux system protein CusB n=1 Tax=Poriferisphaera corsica TaxID=2528020 RepID=A0A517YS53_9BACT|nr:efflux RND transporter periplasmic adaptor subunit [Poriferisphaera corsica]QDU33067.1 Cation efflux system protein CusB precursor [Poriferisphaera corsica]
MQIRQIITLSLTTLFLMSIYISYDASGQSTSTLNQAIHDHSDVQGGEDAHNLSKQSTQMYTCSMHPQVRLSDPDAKCPICGMALIPVADNEPDNNSESDSTSSERRITLSSQAVALLDIEVTPVIRAPAVINIDLVGKIDYDETRLTYITAWFGGRLDRLFVDYTGTPVRKGDHLAEIYSPAVFTAQEELLQALRVQKAASSVTNLQVKRTNQLLLKAARDKLRLWGLSPEQINKIEQRGTASERVTLYALNSGVVVNKNANQGSYVETGTRIYTIADLSQLWLNLSAYESDLAWLRYGQTVSFSVQAIPGREFTGTIAFISPVLNEASRTVQVRVNVPNTERILKPGMLASAEINATTSSAGRVIDPDLADKYICPMHPEEVSNEADNCSVCGMPLVSAESLGYTSIQEFETTLPLLIPRSSVLLTGRRAVVYVSVPGQSRPTFEGREIILGPRAGEQYIVESGLQEDDLVVTSGNFSIDSALQIQAKPSMMSPEGGGSLPGHGGMDHGDMQMISQNVDMQAEDTHTDHGSQIQFNPETIPIEKGINKLINQYLAMSKALADDDLTQAEKNVKDSQEQLQELSKLIARTDDESVENSDLAMSKIIQQHTDQIAKQCDVMAQADDIESLREHFAPYSTQMIKLVRAMPSGSRDVDINLAFCPMARDFTGAHWLQAGKNIRNPYFGASMLTCGEIQDIQKNDQEAGR